MPFESMETGLPLLQHGQQRMQGAGNFFGGLLSQLYGVKTNQAMYKAQRRDALSDWAMQNEYNSPREQMRRLRDAGLNPNLVYGHGADAQSGANIRQSDYGRSEFNLPGGRNIDFMGMYDMRLKSAEADNLTAQNDVIEQEKFLKEAQTLATLQSVDTSKFNLEQQMRLKDISYESHVAALDKLHKDISSVEAHTKVALDNNDRAAAMQAYNIKEAVQRILTARKNRAHTDAQIKMIDKQLQLLDQDEQLKQYEIDLNKRGVNKGDPWYWRGIQNIFNYLNRVNKPASKPWQGESYPLELPKN